MDDYIGPAISVGDQPDDRAVMLTLLIRLARKTAFYDSIKRRTEEPKIGDLVVETSSFRPIPDPHSIGWLRGFDTDDTNGLIFWIEPLFAASGMPWESWGNASFMVVDRKYWQDLGIGEVPGDLA